MTAPRLLVIAASLVLAAAAVPAQPQAGTAAVRGDITVGVNIGNGGASYGGGYGYYIRNASWSLSGVQLAFVPDIDQSAEANALRSSFGDANICRAMGNVGNDPQITTGQDSEYEENNGNAIGVLQIPYLLSNISGVTPAGLQGIVFACSADFNLSYDYHDDEGYDPQGPDGLAETVKTVSKHFRFGFRSGVITLYPNQTSTPVELSSNYRIG